MKILYTKDHEWVVVEKNVATVGISAYAAEQMGDVVFVELPEQGRELEQGDDAAVVESVKAASEIYAPLDGVVVAVNEELTDNPSQVNDDPEGEGWFYKIRLADPDQVDGLFDADDYQSYLETLD